jgi:hypothetical protein
MTQVDANTISMPVTETSPYEVVQISGKDATGLVAEIGSAEDNLLNGFFFRAKTNASHGENSVVDFLVDSTQKRDAGWHRQHIHRALQKGNASLARDLAQQAIKLHPADIELRKMVSLLAPPRLIALEKSDGSNWDHNRQWLNTHWDEYKGSWVALFDGELLASARSLSDISESIRNTAGVLFTRVY